MCNQDEEIYWSDEARSRKWGMTNKIMVDNIADQKEGRH